MLFSAVYPISDIYFTSSIIDSNNITAPAALIFTLFQKSDFFFWNKVKIKAAGAVILFESIILLVK